MANIHGPKVSDQTKVGLPVDFASRSVHIRDLKPGSGGARNWFLIDVPISIAGG